MFSKWFNKKVDQIKNFWYSTTLTFEKPEKQPCNSPEIMRVVNKFASIFMDADVFIQNTDDEINEAKTEAFNKLLATDPLYRGKSSLLKNLCKISLLWGGAILKKTIINNEVLTFDLLSPEHITETKNSQANRLTITNFRELFTTLKYSDFYTGSIIDLPLDEINFFVDNPSPQTRLNLISRLSEIQGKIDNSFYANNMLSSLMNRCSFMFLTRENKNEFSTLNTITETEDRTKNFNDAYGIDKSAVVPVGDNMRVLNTSINVRGTGVFDTFEDTINATCNLLGITRAIIEIQGTTFANQQGAIKDAIANGVQSFADKVAAYFTEILKEHDMLEANERVVFDYSTILARNLAATVEDVETIDENQNETIQNPQNEQEETD